MATKLKAVRGPDHGDIGALRYAGKLTIGPTLKLTQTGNGIYTSPITNTIMVSKGEALSLIETLVQFVNNTSVVDEVMPGPINRA